MKSFRPSLSLPTTCLLIIASILVLTVFALPTSTAISSSTPASFHAIGVEHSEIYSHIARRALNIYAIVGIGIGVGVGASILLWILCYKAGCCGLIVLGR